MEKVLLRNGYSCENEIDEEDWKIFDGEDNVEMGESTKQKTESKTPEKQNFREGAKKKDFESLWKIEQRSQSHQKLLHGSKSKSFARLNNSRPRGHSRNKRSMTKQDVDCQMDGDSPRCKRCRFDKMDEKNPPIRNNQNGMFNGRKNETPIKSVQCNDEEMLYQDSPDVPNFESFPREFEANNNNDNSNTPTTSPLREECTVDNTFEINENTHLPKIKPKKHSANKSKKHDKKKDKKERRRQEKENRKKQREKRREERRMEEIRQRNEDLSIHTNEHLFLDDLSDDDEFNDLVIDEETFHDDKDQQPPKEQKEILKPVQVQQKFYNEKDTSEDTYNQDEHLSDVLDHSISIPMKNIIISLQNENKKLLSSISSSQSNPSKVGKIDFDHITVSDDMEKPFNSIKTQRGSDISIKGDQLSPFHLSPLEPPYDFKESIQETKNVIEESASRTCHESSAKESVKSYIDLSQLTCQFPIATTAVIDSFESHPSMKYQMLPNQVSVIDYSKISPMMRMYDLRLRQNVSAFGYPMFKQSDYVAGNTTGRPVISQMIAPRDPRKPQQDLSNWVSAVCTPLLQTHNQSVQQSSINSNMRHKLPPVLCPRMMKVPNDLRRTPMVPRDPRQRYRFDADKK